MGGDAVRHSFAVVIDGVDLTSPDSPDADVLYEAGCDDALLGSSAGVQRAVFDREAPGFAAAVASVITAVESGIPGARVTAAGRLDPAGAPVPHSG
jgi:hypothetical protein